MNEIFFGISLITYIIFMIIVGIAYIAYLIQTSRDERNEFEAGMTDYLMSWIILTWPITGLPGALGANDDGHISPIETMFIIFEVLFWMPLLLIFMFMWL